MKYNLLKKSILFFFSTYVILFIVLFFALKIQETYFIYGLEDVALLTLLWSVLVIGGWFSREIFDDEEAQKDTKMQMTGSTSNTKVKGVTTKIKNTHLNSGGGHI